MEDGEVRSECICRPEGGNCEHGYALCLHWMNDRADCLDLRELRGSLSRMEKKDLIEVLLRAVEMHPEDLDRMAGNSLLRAGGASRFAQARVNEVLTEYMVTREAGKAADDIGEVLSVVKERREELGDEAAADLTLSIYGDITGALDRRNDPEGALAEQAKEAASLFYDLCETLDPPSRDRFGDRAMELFFRAGKEAGGYLVLLSVVTPSKVDAMVEEIDRRVAGAAGRRGPSPAVTSDEARRAAAEVLAEAGKVEEAVSRLTAPGSDISSAFRAAGLLLDAGQEPRAAELMMACRPADPRERRAWNVLVLMGLQKLQERGKLSVVRGDLVEEVAVSLLRNINPLLGNGPIVTAKELLEASGGPGSFEQAVLSIRDRKERAWAFVKAGDAVKASETYAAWGRRNAVLAWEIAQAAEREGLADLRDEMAAEALAGGGTDEMFKPRCWPRTEAALASMDPRRLAAFVRSDRVPAERRADTIMLLAGRDPELAAMSMDRLVPHLSRDALFGLLGELWAERPDLAVKGFRTWAKERLSSTRHYAEVVDGLRRLKAIAGKEEEEWSSLLGGLLEGYGDRKRLWELIAAEGWQARGPAEPHP